MKHTHIYSVLPIDFMCLISTKSLFSIISYGSQHVHVNLTMYLSCFYVSISSNGKIKKHTHWKSTTFEYSRISSLPLPSPKCAMYSVLCKFATKFFFLPFVLEQLNTKIRIKLKFQSAEQNWCSSRCNSMQKNAHEINGEQEKWQHSKSSS